MPKLVVAAASYYNKKCFFSPECESMPPGVRAEAEDLCKRGAELTAGIFEVACDEGGGVILSSSGAESDYGYDEIGARLVTDGLLRESPELIKSIQLWHALYVTRQGKALREKLTRGEQ